MFDMFEYIQANAGVGPVHGKAFEGFAGDVARHGLEVWIAGVAQGNRINALRFPVQGNDELTVKKLAGEVPDAASDLDDAAAEFGQDKAALPCEIVLRHRHTALIFESVR